MKTRLIKDNPTKTLNLLLKRLGYPYSFEIADKMKAHPNFPSFMSFYYILKSIDIESIALKLTYDDLKNKGQSPIIVNVTTNVSYFLIIEKVCDNFVQIIDGSRKGAFIKKSDFLKMWDGRCLVINTENLPSYPSISINNYISIAKKIFFATGIAFMLFYLIFFHIQRDIYNLLYLLLYSVGILFSLLIVWRSIDSNNMYLKKICTFKNSTSCSSILDSDAAYFLKIFSWGDIGCIFMLIHFIICIIIPYDISNTIACTTSILAFGYVFYSIYYQKFIANSWCKLCLYVQAVLLSLLLLSSIYITHTDITFTVSPATILDLILISIFIVIIFYTVKPLIFSYINYPPEKKRNSELIHFEPVKEILCKTESYINTEKVLKINITNNANVVNELLIVFNPMCDLCIRDLKNLFKFIERKNDINFNLIFFTNEKVSKESHIIAHNLLWMYTKNPDTFKVCLKQYVLKYPKIKKKYNMYFAADDKTQIIQDSQNKWCVANKFAGTPIVILNNRILHSVYSIEDIDYMFE